MRQGRFAGKGKVKLARLGTQCVWVVQELAQEVGRWWPVPKAVMQAVRSGNISYATTMPQKTYLLLYV